MLVSRARPLQATAAGRGIAGAAAVTSATARPLLPRCLHSRSRSTTHLRHAYYSAPTGDYQPQQPPQQDLFSRAFEFCGQAAAHAASAAVARATDVAAALLPDSTPRDRVETAVKGALALLALALLQSVLSFVLVLGAAALALYIVTQVLGWDFSGGSGWRGAAPPPGQQQQQQQQQQQWGQQWSQQAPGWQQQQQGPWLQQQQGYGGYNQGGRGPQQQQQRPGGGGGYGGAYGAGAQPGRQQQGDVIDVFYTPPPQGGGAR